MPIKRSGIQFHKVSEGQYIAVHFASGTSYLIHKTAVRRWEVFPLLIDEARYRGDHARLHTGVGDSFGRYSKEFIVNDGFKEGREIEYRAHATDENGKPKIKKHGKHSGFRSAVTVGGFEKAREWNATQHSLKTMSILAGEGE